MITFDAVIDTPALLREASHAEKVALLRAYHVNLDPRNAQATRDAGARFFHRILLRFVCGRPN